MNVPEMNRHSSSLIFAGNLFGGELKIPPFLNKEIFYEEAVELGKKDAKLFPIDSRGFPLDNR